MKISNIDKRFGRMWRQVEFRSILSNPINRPLGQMILFIPLVSTALLAGLATWLTPPPLTVTMLAVIYVVGVGVAAGTLALTSPRVEAKAFSAAPYKWLLSITAGSAGAYARPDRKHRLTLHSVWANPQGKEIGPVLMTQVLAETPSNTDLWLTAVNTRVAEFYRRFGFVRISRGLLGIRMVLRRRAEVGPEYRHKATVPVTTATRRR